MSSGEFRGISIKREDILRAMTVFDQQYPASFKYGGWYDPGNQHYFIRIDGRAYPPRFILSLSTGMDPELFAVEGLTYRVFDDLGFEVVDLTLDQPWRYTLAGNTDETNLAKHPISSLGLSVRSYNALARRGVTTIAQLAEMSDEDLFRVRNLGQKSVDEIREALTAYLEEHPTWRHKSVDNDDETLPETHPISSLGLSVRSYNALARRGITTVAQLAAMSDEELFQVRNLSQKSVDEIREALTAYLEEHPINDDFGISAEQDSGTEFSGEDTTLRDEDLMLEPDGKLTSLEVLELPIRAHNALARSDIKTVGQLARMSEEDMLEVRNLGMTSLGSIVERLDAYLKDHPLQPVQEGSTTVAEPPVLESMGLHSSLIEQEVLSKVEHIPIEDIPLARLALSPAAEKEIRSAGIRSIGDLAKTTPVIVKQSTVVEVRDRTKSYLAWLLEQNEDSWKGEIADRDISPLYRMVLEGATIEAMITDWFTFLSDRQQLVLHRRFGLRGQVRTLEEVGQELDLTRERIRQIEKQALKALSTPSRCAELLPLSAAIVHTLNEHAGVLRPLALLGSLKRNYSVQIGTVSYSGLLSLVATVFGQVEISERDDIVFLTSIALQDIFAVQRKLVAILRESDKPLSRRYLLKCFKHTDLYQESSGGLSDDFIVTCLRSSTRIERDDTGRYALRRSSWRRKSFAVRAMRAIGEPTHYSEIAARFNELVPERQRLSDHNLHAYLGRFPKLFVRVGHGVYGLAEWGLSNDGKVGNTAYKILCDAGRPLHIDPLTQEVLKTWHVNPGSVLAAVETDDRFIRIGRGVYALREQVNGDANSETQIDFGDVFADKLEHWQEELDQRRPSGVCDAQSEVDAIRSFGSDFFND